MATPGKSGRPSKGRRKPTMVRLPEDHHSKYLEIAERAGLPLGDYLALQLARSHDLPEPSYIYRPRQQPLPMAV